MPPWSCHATGGAWEWSLNDCAVNLKPFMVSLQDHVRTDQVSLEKRGMSSRQRKAWHRNRAGRLHRATAGDTGGGLMTDTAAMQARIGEPCHQFKLPTMGARSVSRFTAAGHGDALATFLEVLEIGRNA